MSDENAGAAAVPEPTGNPSPAPEARASDPTTQPDRPKTERPAPPAGGVTARDAGIAATNDGVTGDGATSDGSGPTGDGGAPRPRRRGSRGGRNRRKPNPNATGDVAPDSESGPDRSARGDTAAGESADRQGGDLPNRTRNARAASDRGFTAEDVGAEARQEAGLATPPPSEVTRPKIGDSRPAPVVVPADGDERAGGGSRPQGERDGTGVAKRRRRRGGRNRSRSGAGGSGNGGGPGQGGGDGRDGPAGTVVTSSIPADGGTSIEDLDEETLERRRGRTRKGRPTGRYQMIVHVGDDRTIQMGVLEGRSLVEHYVSRPEDGATSIDGNIYLGKVQNVLPGMEAAFVDIGTPKNGVIYQRDVQFDATDMEGGGAPKIETALKNGQSILVQVTKNPIGAKGARLTQDVSLAGRFVVMVPNQPTTYGISKRLPDDERKRLRKVLEGIRPTDAGLIVRTAAEGATADELARDLARLQDQWRQISSLAAQSKPGTLLYREPPLVVRVIREEFTKEYRSVVIDDDTIFGEVKSYVDAIAPELSERVERYEDEHLPIFERFHVHEQLHKALDRKVWLPSGGSLIVERTEALTVVDVNTGKNVGKSNLEDTVFQNNLEAADEIARQLRLRDIGGIIVIDFIDM
ncbi:MAG: Rne/Rng family ribonuclease, partial [Acidimicrobiia bacterium]